MKRNIITISCSEYDSVNDKVIRIDHKMTYEHYDDFVNPCYAIQDLIKDMRNKIDKQIQSKINHES